MNTETTEVIKFEEISSTLMSAGDVLTSNRSLLEKAENKAKLLLDTIEAEGMSDELDAEVNDWQIKAKQALKINNDRRTPITQLLTKISREFTALENPLDGTKPDSHYAKLQSHRNKWATHKESERKAKEAEILRKQQIDQDKIRLASDAEQQIRSKFTEKLFSFKGYLSNLVNNATLSDFNEVEVKIKSQKVEYPKDKFVQAFDPILYSQVLSYEQIDEIKLAAKEKLYNELSANFRENMEVDKQNTLDLLPSKKKELERIAKADASEAERLRQEAESRKKIEEAKLKQEQEEQAKADAAKLEAEKQLNNATNLFDTAAQMAEVQSATGKVKKSYIISVKDAAGWGAIFLFFFEKVGQSLDVEAFGKKTMNQMKKECEKVANNTGEMIEHPSIEYAEDVKAVVTK